MAIRMLIDGLLAERVSVLDRGLCYGDGLFESIRFVGAQAPLWSRHMQRLQEGCQRLAIPAPDPDNLFDEALAVSRGLPQAVVRITLTRGIGTRGYAPPVDVVPCRIVAAFDMPSIAPDAAGQGIRIRRCQLTLAEQPRLAGLKHLNRLEQVLARSEWSDPSIAEGLLCDAADRAICATMANLFAVIDGQLVTPALDRCGVAGVARAEVLAVRSSSVVRDLAFAGLACASELFLTSSIRGILPVQSLGDIVLSPGVIARGLQQHWRDLGFPLEQA
jgi:4-amino-4-deoxychorismate lyase